MLYEALLEDCSRARVFAGARGAVLRRGNLTRRFWRPAWDGDSDDTDPQKQIPPVLAGFTFHEGRHTHRTWLSDDGISDIGRAARLGHKLPGMADVYEHLTPEMKQRTAEGAAGALADIHHPADQQRTQKAPRHRPSQAP